MSDADKLKFIEENKDVLRRLKTHHGVFRKQEQIIKQIVEEQAKKQIDELAESMGAAENYVPRGAHLSDKQKLSLAKTLEDLEEAKVIAAKASGVKNPSSADLSFLKKRSKLSRENINAYIEKEYGIKDYFHNDPVLAYNQKIEALDRAANLKKFADDVINHFPKDESLWPKVQRAAQDKLASGSADNTVRRFAYTNTDSLQPLDPTAIQKLQKLTGRDLSLMKFPAPVADLINGRFRSYTSQGFLNKMQMGLQAYNKGFKGAVFFNPGFHLRNHWESIGRSYNVGLSPSEVMSGINDIWSGPSPKDKRILESFDKLIGSHQSQLNHEFFDDVNTQTRNVMSNLEKRRQMSKIQVSRDMLQSDNPFKRFVDSVKYQARTMSKDKFYKFLKDQFTVKDNVLVDNPVYRFSTAVNEYGEKGYRYAYFKKLVKEGYNEEVAAQKVNDAFMDYSRTRQFSKNGAVQMIYPFINYAVKNGETWGRMFAMKPAAAFAFGPHGAIERSLKEWGGGDPEQADRIQSEMGPFYGDHFMLWALPYQEDVLKQKDYVKQKINKMMTATNDTQAGRDLWLKLPSSTHGLRMLDPASLDEMASPLMKAGLAWLNKNPITGEQLVTPGSKDEYKIRGQAALKELWNPIYKGIVPTRVLEAARGEINKMWPDLRDDILDLGFSKEFTNTVLGNNWTTRDREGAQKALDTIKTFWMGTTTKSDLAIMGTIDAEERIFKEEAQRLESQMTSRGTNWFKKEYKSLLEHYHTRLSNLYKVYGDIKDRRMRGEDDNAELEIIPDSEVETLPPGESKEIPSTPERLENKMREDDMSNMDLPPARDPQSVNESMFDRAGGLARKYLGESASQFPESQGPTNTDYDMRGLLPPDITPQDINREPSGNQVVIQENGKFYMSPNMDPAQAGMWKQRAEELIKKYNLETSRPADFKFLNEQLLKEFKQAPQWFQNPKQWRLPASQ